MHLEYLHFMGQLFGLALRSKQYLNLNLPSWFWKQLAFEPCTLADLEEVDQATAATLRAVRLRLAVLFARARPTHSSTRFSEVESVPA